MANLILMSSIKCLFPFFRRPVIQNKYFFVYYTGMELNDGKNTFYVMIYRNLIKATI